jgi:hypothetical protein
MQLEPLQIILLTYLKDIPATNSSAKLRKTAILGTADIGMETLM